MSATLKAPTASSTTRLLQAALDLAALGYPVFPCSPGSKKPIKNSNGLKDATTDEVQIESWWQRWPTANPALRTDGLLVLDFDPVDGKPNEWLTDDPEKFLDLAQSPMSITPRGGRHYFFKQPVGGDFGNDASGKLAPGVDIRGNGGYVLVAPSAVDGKSYEWLQGSELDCSPDKLPEVPAWLAAMLTATKSKPSKRTDKLQSGNPIADGSRNSTLTSMAGVMRRHGMGYSEIAAALHAANTARCVPPLDNSEVESIARSVSQYEPNAIATAAVEGQCLADIPTEAENPNRDPGPTPAHLFKVPGFIGDFKDFILSASPYPSEPLAFAAALATQSLLAGRKVKDVFENRTNLYIVALANSASGKGHPRKLAKRLLQECNLGSLILDTVASAEGLEDFLARNPAVLLLQDEFDGLMSAVTLLCAGSEPRVLLASY